MKPNKIEENDLKRIREQLDMTLDEFAVAMGMSKTHLSLVENGHRPLSRKVRRAANALLSHSSQTISNSVVNNGSGFVINRPDPSEPSAPHPEPLTAIEVRLKTIEDTLLRMQSSLLFLVEKASH